MFDIRIPPLAPNTVFTPPVTDEEKLALAIRSGDSEGIKALIAQNPDLLNGNLDQEYDYHTPLSYAASLGLCPEIQTLLDLDASPSHSTPILGVPPLAAASQAAPALAPKVAQIFNIILNHAKQLGNEAVKRLTEWRGADGDTLLTLLSESGHFLAIRKLLAVAPELATYSRNDGNYPLHLAIINGHELSARIILDQAPGVVNEVNDQENSPLLLSMIYNSSPQFTRKLLECGADVNSMDPAGNTALILAFYLEDGVKANIIFEYDPDTTPVNIHDMAAISYAALSGKPELIKLFRGKNKPNPEDITPPHFHLILSPPSEESTFREMLAEISSQGYSVRESHQYSTIQFRSSSELQKSRMEIIKSENNFRLSGISQNTPKEISPEDGPDDIFYLITPSKEKENELISREFIIYEDDICPINHYSDYSGIRQRFMRLYSRMFHKYNAKSLTKTITAMSFIRSAFNKEPKIEIAKLLEIDIFVYFLKNLIYILFQKKEVDFQLIKECTNKFFFSLQEYNKEAKIEYINDLLIKYFYESSIYNLENNSKLEFLANLAVFTECFNGSIKSIILYKQIISLFNKKYPAYDILDIGMIMDPTIRIVAEKIKKDFTNESDSGKAEIYAFLHIHDISIYISNEAYLIRQKGSPKELIFLMYEKLKGAESALKFLNYLGELFVDFNKNTIKLNEIIFEFKYHICLSSKDIMEKKDEVIKQAKSALAIPVPQKYLLQSESDRDRKRKILKRIIKNLNQNDVPVEKNNLSLEKEQENATANPIVNETNSDNAGPSAPPEAESTPKPPVEVTPLPKSQVQIDTNIITTQMPVPAHADYIRLVESQQLSTLKTRRRYKIPTQPAGNQRANIAPVPVKQPKWSETEVRQIYSELLKPSDELVILERPGRPYGSYWGIFRLAASDYDDPREHEQDLKKFKEDTSLMCTKGVFYMHNTGKGNRPHATSYTSKNGPVLIIIDRLLNHKDHERELNLGFAPKPHLLRTPILASA